MDKTTFVMTSIYDVEPFLESYYQNLKGFSHLDDVCILILSDKKAANNGIEDRNADTCANFFNMGLNVEFWRYKPLLRFVKDTDYLKKLLPTAVNFGSSAIRNFGFLMAAHDGCDRIIVLDDDNLAPINEDFYLGHSCVGNRYNLKVVEPCHGNFVNTCDFLEFNTPDRVFARGYPLSQRAYDHRYKFSKKSGAIILNLGLWTGTPDIFALDSLMLDNIESVGWTYKKASGLAVSRDAYLPLNTQNVCIQTKWLPCYYFWSQDLTLGGFKLGRFDDLWQGYFAKLIIDSMKGDNYVTFGSPLTRHRRNPHDLIKDLKQEYLGHTVNNAIIDLINRLALDEQMDLHEAVRTVIGRLSWFASDAKYLHPQVQSYLKRISINYSTWLDSCAMVGL